MNRWSWLKVEQMVHEAHEVASDELIQESLAFGRWPFGSNLVPVVVLVFFWVRIEWFCGPCENNAHFAIILGVLRNPVTELFDSVYKAIEVEGLLDKP